MTAAVAAAPAWLGGSTGYDLTQAATACAQLQYSNSDFMEMLLQQGLHLAELPPPSQQQRTRGPAGKKHVQRSKALAAPDKASLAGLCSISVVQLDMQQLAGLAKALVVASGVSALHDTHPSNLRRLWLFHSWLLQHQLLDGRGLAKVLTQDQLQVGQRESARYGVK